jgi:hypothetical protein
MHGTQRPISLQTVNRQTGAVKLTAFRCASRPVPPTDAASACPARASPATTAAQAGDLYLRVRHASHPDFTTREADVHHELDVAPWEAVLGAEVIVPTLDGSIKLRIPAGMPKTARSSAPSPETPPHPRSARRASWLCPSCCRHRLRRAGRSFSRSRCR